MSVKLKLGHVALRTTLYDETLAFYKLLGGVVDQEDSITRDGQTFRLALMSVGEVGMEVIESTDAAGEIQQESELFVHLCFSLPDLDAFVQELRDKGVDTFKTEHVLDRDLFGGIRQINLFGPSGELLELLEEKPA